MKTFNHFCISNMLIMKKKRKFRNSEEKTYSIIRMLLYLSIMTKDKKINVIIQAPSLSSFVMYWWILVVHLPNLFLVFLNYLCVIYLCVQTHTYYREVQKSEDIPWELVLSLHNVGPPQGWNSVLRLSGNHIYPSS